MQGGKFRRCATPSGALPHSWAAALSPEKNNGSQRKVVLQLIMGNRL